MNKLYTTLLCLFLCFSLPKVKSQGLGSRPNHQQWKKLTIENYRILFPLQIKSQALRTAKILQQLQQNNPIGWQTKRKKTTLLLEHKPFQSNGYVALAPFRADLYTTPPFSANSLSTANWLQMLTIHEQRHLQQYNQTLHGLTKAAYYIGGELSWSLFQQLSIPNWFFEGDAVLSETALTKSGRGRVPYFSVFQRSIARQGITYDYHKIRNGSFKDLVPNHYQWGYRMLSTLTAEKGFQILRPILKDAAAYKHVFYPFSRSLKKHSGYSSHSLYEKSWESAKRHWTNQLADRTLTPTKSITDTNLKVVRQFYYPQYISDSSFVVRSESRKKTSAILWKNNLGESKVICRPGPSGQQYFHYRDSFLVWTTHGHHPRRTQETYENIVIYNMRENKKKRLTQKGRYAFPNILPEKSKIYAIQFSENQQSALVAIDLKNHKQRQLKLFPPSAFISQMSISNKGEKVVYTKRKNGKIAIFTFQLKDKVEEQITPFSNHVIDAPRLHNGFVYYQASFNQIDNLFKSPLDGSKSITQLSSVPLGAYQVDVSPDGGELLFKEVIFNGNKLSKMKLENAVNKNIELVEPLYQDWNAPQLDVALSEQLGLIETDSLIHNKKEITPYGGIFRGFKLHSWPITASPAVQEINVYFDNYLNDISATVGGGYNLNEKGQFYNAQISYGRWFPVLSLGGSYNFRNIEQIGVLSRFSESLFRQKSIVADILLPLQWQLGNYQLGTKIGLNVSHRELSNGFDQYKEAFQLAGGHFNFSLKRRKAMQQLASPLGFKVDLSYGRSIRELDNEKFQLEGRLFLPSFFRTHSLQLSVGFKRELEENIYRHIDNFTYNRGFNYPFSDEYLRYSADYQLPIVYPDWGFLGISYFKRIRANLFFDYAHNQLFLFDETYDLKSSGITLYFDNTFFNSFPLSIGLRGSYQIDGPQVGQNSSNWRYSIMISNSF